MFIAGCNNEQEAFPTLSTKLKIALIDTCWHQTQPARGANYTFFLKEALYLKNTSTKAVEEMLDSLKK